MLRQQSVVRNKKSILTPQYSKVSVLSFVKPQYRILGLDWTLKAICAK